MFVYFEKRRAKDLREAIENGCAVPLSPTDVKEVVNEMKKEGVLDQYSFVLINKYTWVNPNGL